MNNSQLAWSDTPFNGQPQAHKPMCKKKGGKLEKKWEQILVFKKCKGDFYEDGDVDGEDIFEFTKDENGVILKRFADELGRTDCE